MTKRNFVSQEGFKDCGPACLLMIIKYYKGYIELDDLKEMCKTNVSGTDAYHLIEAAKEIGFNSYGVKCELKNINKDNMILPCIAHVIIDDSYTHYVVIEKINYQKKKILIKDPANKTKYYTFKEFEKIYNNILIFLYPIKNITYNTPNSLYKFIIKIIENSKKQIIDIIIISFFITLLSISSSFYLQNIIDNISFGKRKLVLVFIIFLIISLLKTISDFFRNKLLILINQKLDLELTNETFKNIILLPYCYYRNNTTGEIVSKINDLDVVRQVISKVAISFVDLPLTIITLIVMYIINSTLFFISIIIMLLYFLVVLIFRNSLNEHINSCHVKKACATSYMVESINGFESVKGSNMSNKIINSFQYKYIDMLKSIYKFDNCYNKEFLCKELISNLGFLTIIFVGSLLVIENKLSLGTLLSFSVLMNYFLDPIRNVVDLDYNIKQAKNAIKRVLNMFLKESNLSIVDKAMKGNIEIKDLSYSFDEENNVLKNIDLSIKKGNKVMVIGNSGGGKSTLFKILKKYYKVQRNKVFINDIDINDYEKSDIVYISQNEILFTDTILNNIGGLSKIIKICMVDEIIKNSDLGYNTLIEENGFNISGGEKQRIILARSINNPFEILIIDEGLNQVDINMERKIIKNLIEEYKDKTIIIISHRYDNMDLFDQVIKLEEGVIENVEKNR